MSLEVGLLLGLLFADLVAHFVERRARNALVLELAHRVKAHADWLHTLTEMHSSRVEIHRIHRESLEAFDRWVSRIDEKVSMQGRALEHLRRSAGAPS